MTHFIISPNQATLRRKNRRERASARRLWFFHRRGIVKLNSGTLHRIKRTLAHHHSRDRHFLLTIKESMSQQTEAYPWRCLNCNRINKKLAITCAKCYAHWTSGIRHSTEPKNMSSSQSQWKPWQEWTDTNADWTWQDHRSGSRRPSRKPNREATPHPDQPAPGNARGRARMPPRERAQVENRPMHRIIRPFPKPCSPLVAPILQ